MKWEKVVKAKRRLATLNQLTEESVQELKAQNRNWDENVLKNIPQEIRFLNSLTEETLSEPEYQQVLHILLTYPSNLDLDGD